MSKIIFLFVVYGIFYYHCCADLLSQSLQQNMLKQVVLGQDNLLANGVLELHVRSDTTEKIGVSFFQPVTHFNPKRFYTSLTLGTIAYTGTMIGLSKVWYDEEPVAFHFFNDRREWEQMDKMGHVFASYHYGHWLYHGARWCGIKKVPSLWIAGGASTLFQLSIEFLDGRSEKWGFSMWDVAANSLGTAVFIGQEWAWDEQRFYLKFSTFPDMGASRQIELSDNITLSQSEISKIIFGSSFLSQLLKNYNNQTYWLSLNPHHLFHVHFFPQWLNLAVGYGVNNVYGGFENKITIETVTYPIPLHRTQYFYFSPDIDWERLSMRSPFFKALAVMLNSIKTPAPAVSINSEGQFQFHLLFF